ncbi:MAG: hypothetical protein UY78_C0028G0007 [Parcubacteria group bacterium GW2011_GWA1_53_13]|nr:MAG: hypothetical protein UY78_C0028G0007 [Parcubacteria group bacterium GW2011_GWA1_53_13]
MMNEPQDAFSRYGGSMSREQMNQYIDLVTLTPEEREYAKRIMERFDIAAYSMGITREEFFQGLDEMANNPNDPIDPQEVERIKERFK